MHTPFDEPIHVTRPLLPDLDLVQKHLEDIWQSKWLTNNGPKHQQLEAALKDTLKVAGISLFNNGTIALLVACRALALTGEVITTPFTFPATTHSLAWCGLQPVFCDIDPHTLTIDPTKIERLITPKTSAIFGVHVYGIPCHVEAIQKIADKYRLKVMYDAAHAFGVEINGRSIGTFGDISMFSFHATKLFHTIEGGCLTYNDASLKTQIDYLKNFGIKNPDEVVLAGINGKMNEIQAAMGLINLTLLEEERAKRAQIENVYLENLDDIPGISIVQRGADTTASLQYFVIRVDQAQYGISRDDLHDQLKSFNVITRKYFYPLCSNYPCYRHLPSADVNDLPVANRVVEEVLALPLYGELSLDDTRQICRLIRSFAHAHSFALCGV